MFIGVERRSFPRRFLSRLEFGGFSETCYHGQPGSHKLACWVSIDKKRACIEWSGQLLDCREQE